MIVALLAACAPPESGSDLDPTVEGTTDPVVPVVCSLLVEADDIAVTWTSDIVTEEDFDFDGEGHLVIQVGSDLHAVDRDGTSRPIAPNAGYDVTGIRSTADGDIAVARENTGSVGLVDATSGGSITLLADLTNPNGVEAGEDGMVYVTETTPNGRIRMVDPATGAFEIVVDAPNANGIVLSPDEEVLYFVDYEDGRDPQTRILSVARDGDGSWDPSTLQVLYGHPEFVGSITIDACGNLYGLEYLQGKVFRVDTATGEAQMLIDVEGSGSFSALHFAPGFGDWDAASLFVTSRYGLFEIPTGVVGSHVLTPSP